MTTNVLLTAGSVLRGDDAAGPYLAKLFENNPVEGWQAIDGGLTPEDDIGVVRFLRPDLLVLVDAAAMGEAPGTIKVLSREDVTSDYLMTTHAMPMTFLLDNLEDSCDQLIFLGIQAAHTDILEPLSAPVLAAVEFLYGWLKNGARLDELPIGPVAA